MTIDETLQCLANPIMISLEQHHTSIPIHYKSMCSNLKKSKVPQGFECNPHFSQSNNGYIKKRINVLCANCGGMGHIYKNCNHPIISYGIICYKICNDGNKCYPKYLMIQRKDSLSYVEFIRGKYNIKNKTYICDMFALMTESERQGIQSHSFEKLWQDMWCKNIHDENKNFTKEYKEACDKFALLKKGYFIKNKDDMTFFSLDYVISTTSSKYNETEWGFPKGRRNINEGDVHCALREFKEETGINQNSIQLCRGLKPLEEVFSGTNNVRYKHVYYAAKLINDAKGDTILIDPKNKQQCKEIRNIKWFTYEEALEKIRDMNMERREIFRRLHQTLLKHINVKIDNRLKKMSYTLEA